MNNSILKFGLLIFLLVLIAFSCKKESNYSGWFTFYNDNTTYSTAMAIVINSIFNFLNSSEQD